MIFINKLYSNGLHTANDYYEIAWTSDSHDVFLSHVLSPTYGPEIPSVIVTITQL